MDLLGGIALNLHASVLTDGLHHIETYLDRFNSVLFCFIGEVYHCSPIGISL